MTNATTPTARYLDAVGLSKSYHGTRVIDGLDFSVARGELVSLLGPSGCGKTTLLRLIAGLVSSDDGNISIGTRNVTRTPAHKRNVSVVFQNYALFPHLKVAENVAFGLRARKVDKATIPDRVAEALHLVRMTEFADRPVAALSGGQQQRVAVARALVVQPDLLLLDEPFSALDRKLRETMQVELKTLLRDRGITAIFVTHDQEEALAVSHRIAVMNEGRIEQFTAPAELYARPATPFALDFVGLSTRIHATARGNSAETAYGTLPLPDPIPDGTPLLIGVRPENITLGDAPITLSAEVADVMILGSKTHVHCRSEGDDRLLCELPGTVSGITPGQKLTLGWAPENTLVYEVPA
ncbi:ABC transporter ATP-binding protein [Algicella marina]|uniref:ATP-binding cassette domain-containing protein n=1 Tax=Algicella marina TaxID=2683284 RepID=A0A6P1SYD9_9RHOB|nr:ABC transporter ATP-binding protein [Algicella marina]QHQ34373.1 ATP-binding cassette domain-containing protein [Algicella marina]